LRRREQDPGAVFYTGRNTRPTHYLRYDWTGWPTAESALPPQTADVARNTTDAWHDDGLCLREAHATPEKVHLLFSATPPVSPVRCCQRAKGRLQHALRQSGTAVHFSRKVSFRCLGENTTAIVANYLRGQVGKEPLADARFREIMRQFTMTYPDVDLTVPSESNSGRYWYNLHVVLVTADRFRITNPGALARIRDAALHAAAAGAMRMAALSVMPDHVHLALRGDIEQSPEEIALCFQNALARAAGCRVWQDSYYVGTFSDYDLSVIRRIVRKS